MNIFFKFSLIISLFFLTSCATTSQRKNIQKSITISAKIEQKQKTISKNQSVLLKSAIDALKKTKESKEVNYAIKILTNLDETLDSSDNSNLIDTNKILYGKDKEKKLEEIKLDKTIKLIKSEQINVIKLKEDNKILQNKIIENAIKIENGNNKNTFWSFIKFGISGVGLVGLILLIIICPILIPIFIKIMGYFFSLLSWIIDRVWRK